MKINMINFAKLVVAASILMASQAFAGSVVITASGKNDEKREVLQIPQGTLVTYTLSTSTGHCSARPYYPYYEADCGAWTWIATADGGFYEDENAVGSWVSNSKSGTFVSSGMVFANSFVMAYYGSGTSTITLSW